MGLPTHPNEFTRKRLFQAWARAHKRFSGGYAFITEEGALAGESDTGDPSTSAESYLVNPTRDPDTHADDGTVDRNMDAMKADIEARTSSGRHDAEGDPWASRG